jgi:hypothetical protein
MNYDTDEDEEDDKEFFKTVESVESVKSKDSDKKSEKEIVLPREPIEDEQPSEKSESLEDKNI